MFWKCKLWNGKIFFCIFYKLICIFYSVMKIWISVVPYRLQGTFTCLSLYPWETNGCYSTDGSSDGLSSQFIQKFCSESHVCSLESCMMAVFASEKLTSKFIKQGISPSLQKMLLNCPFCQPLLTLLFSPVKQRWHHSPPSKYSGTF